MTRITVDVAGVARPIGPFSAVVQGQPQMWLSGQVAQDPHSGKLIGTDAASQAHQVFANIAAILKSIKKSEADVLRVGLYLTDMNDFQAVNAVYAGFFSSPYPVRTAIAVAALPLGALVEIDLILG